MKKILRVLKQATLAWWLTTVLAPVTVMSAEVPACRLPEMNVRADVGLGFPRIDFRLKSTGTVHFHVLFVDFSDVPATQTPQQVMSIISPRAEQYFQAVSYGRLKLLFDTTDRWIRMRKRSADYHFGRGASFEIQRAYMQEAIDLAGSAIGYSDTDAILVIANPDAKAIDWGPGFSAMPGKGIRAGGRYFLNGATSGSDLPILGWTWFNHEIGHVMSLVDLAGPLPANQLWHTYVGDFSVMGNPAGKAPEYLAWERWQLGWLDDSQIKCVTDAETTLTLTPVERAGGLKLALIPTGPTTAVAVESRRPEGFDRRLPGTGPLAYVIDTRLSTHDGAIRVLPFDKNDERHWNSLLKVGQIIQTGNVTVRLLSSDADGDTVSVTQQFTRPDL
jgi:M6 family metalloprotease-like protein